MADPLSLIIGILVLAIAAGLHLLGGRALPSLGSAAFDERLLVRRRWTRYLVSIVMMLAAAAAITAGFVGPGLTWVLLWTAVPLLLLAAVLLAVADAARVRHLYADRLPQIAKEADLPEETHS